MGYEVVGDLPRSKFGKGKVDWPTVLKACDDNPGQWVRVGALSASIASHINHGRYPKIDSTVYQCVSRVVDGETNLFIRRRV